MKYLILLYLLFCLMSCTSGTYHYKAETNEENDDTSFPITKSIEPKYKFTGGSGFGVQGYMYIINNDTIILNSEGGVYKY